MTKWERQTFHRATDEGPKPVDGWTYRGLGLYDNFAGEEWCLVHLNSGLAIVWVAGPKQFAQRRAEKVAELTDWSFKDMAGWKGVDPLLPQKVGAVIATSKGKVWREGPKADVKLVERVSKAVLAERGAA